MSLLHLCKKKCAVSHSEQARQLKKLLSATRSLCCSSKLRMLLSDDKHKGRWRLFLLPFAFNIVVK